MGGRPGLALVELSVVEQRYRAVLEAAAGVPVTEVAAHFGVSRQSVHAWIRRYRNGGLGALMDRSLRQVAPVLYAVYRVWRLSCSLTAIGEAA
jgi:hypothetical protein